MICRKYIFPFYEPLYWVDSVGNDLIHKLNFTCKIPGQHGGDMLLLTTSTDTEQGEIAGSSILDCC
jgi:hypothetical protein